MASSSAYLWSSDDFYTMRESRLVVQESTSSADGAAPIFQKVGPIGQVPTWIRTMLANRFATSGAEWAQTFAKYNSGTYNNQWEVLDVKKFTPGVQPAAGSGLLTVVSQIPGDVKSFDATGILVSQGYWASYNLPYLTEHYNALGLPALAAADKEYSYENCSRARIFRREHVNVKTLEDIQRMINFNRWQTDPASEGNAGHAIAARNDLNSIGPDPSGGIDGKATSALLMMEEQCCKAHVRSGPTNDDQIPFSWADPRWVNMVHPGHPTLFNFTYITQNLATYPLPGPAGSGSSSGVPTSYIVVGVLAAVVVTALAGVYWWKRVRNGGASEDDGSTQKLTSSSDGMPRYAGLDEATSNMA